MQSEACRPTTSYGFSPAVYFQRFFWVLSKPSLAERGEGIQSLKRLRLALKNVTSIFHKLNDSNSPENKISVIVRFTMNCLWSSCHKILFCLDERKITTSSGYINFGSLVLVLCFLSWDMYTQPNSVLSIL